MSYTQAQLMAAADALLPYVTPDGFGEGTDRMRKETAVRAAGLALTAAHAAAPSAAAFDPTYNATVAPSAPREQRDA